MLFKDNFYSLLSKNENEGTVICSIQLNADHDIFKGHFPGNPVTPGVVQMEIVKELLKEHLGKDVKLVSMGNCKFLAILNPEKDSTVDVHLKIAEQEDASLKISAVIQNASGSFLKMGAVYA